MSSIDPAPEQIALSEIPSPPFARLPDPAGLFARRAARFRRLSTGHALGPYLAFLADLTDVQRAVLDDDLPVLQTPAPEAAARAKEHGMPALDSGRFPGDGAYLAALDRLIERATALSMPEPARAALAALAASGPETRPWMARNVVSGSVPSEELVEHVFVAAAMQVHAARAAARLDPAALVPVGDGVCPACGGAPTSSLVVGWEGAHGARYCSCSLCGTLWNYVRIQCVACGSTKGISYKEVESGDESRQSLVRAECCGECGSYLKLMMQTKDPALDPVADDVATTALDLLVQDTGVRRCGSNPFLLGY